MSGNRVFSLEFKVSAARRMVGGESVSALHRELGIKRSVLYRWRDSYRSEGEAGLSRPVGRPPGYSAKAEQRRSAIAPEQAAAEQIAALQRKIGQQALEVDFLRGAFKRVKELRQSSSARGGKASTERCAE